MTATVDTTTRENKGGFSQATSGVSSVMLGGIVTMIMLFIAGFFGNLYFDNL